MTTVELFKLHYYHGIAAIFAVVSVLAFVLNGSVIIIFFGNQELLKPSRNYLLLSMAFSDLLRAVLVTPVAAYANSRHWWTLDQSICQYFAFTSTLLGLTSMVHLMALAVERWTTLKVATTNEVSEMRMATVIGGLWLFSLIWSLCPLLGWSSFGPEPGYAGCSITWNSPIPSDKAFIVCLFVFFFFLPIVIVTFCFISVYNEVRKMAKNAVKRWGTVALPTQETLQAKTKTVKMSVVMVLAFLIAWSPYAVVSIYSSFVSSSISPLLSTLPSLFAKFSTCYNPIIYFFMYTKFRIAGKKMLKKHFVSRDNRVLGIGPKVVLPLTLQDIETARPGKTMADQATKEKNV